MATPANRFQTWIEGLSHAWGSLLGAWAAGFVSTGLELILDKLGQKASAELQPMIDRLQAANPSPELKPILDELKTPTGEFSALSGISFLNRIVGSIRGDVFSYVTRSLLNSFSYSPEFYLPDPSLLMDYYFRGIIPDRKYLYSLMRQHGIPPDETDKLLQAKRALFPSSVVIEAWLRNPDKYASYFDDVYTLMGLDKNFVPDQQRIELLKDLAHKLPSAQEAITWLAHEVFEPASVEKYGLDDEFSGLNLELMRQIGITNDMSLNYWRSHWSHASFSQMVEMLHRGVLRDSETVSESPETADKRKTADKEGESAVSDWFKLVEIPPYWRPGLTATMWNVPGRVEARMMAQYGLVDKPFLVELLARDGLAPEYRDIVADMMLVRGIRSDIQTRYTKKWINATEVRAEIASYNMGEQVADRLYKWIVTNGAGERTSPERDLTAAEIIRGYKKQVISYTDAVEELVALGYDEDEAAYKIAIDTELVKAEASPDLSVRIDTIRRQRRQRIIDRAAEVGQLLALNIDPDVVNAYADNDDLRLVKVKAPAAAEVIPEYLTDDGKVNVETIRLSRRQRRISRLEEITSLLDLDMSEELAVAYADNDDLRLIKQTTEGV